jgi:hypothetical protein
MKSVVLPRHNNKEAVAAGTRTAGQQACDVPHIHPDKVKLQIPRRFKLFTGDEVREFDEYNPVTSWTKDKSNHINVNDVKWI